MSENNLRARAKTGVLWGTVERFGTQGVQFLFSLILARLLSPSDYGIIAMPLIFLTIAQVFIDSGFANALIRKPDLRDEDLSTALYFSIIVGLFFYLLLYFTSPLIAEFYNTPILADILKVTALTTLFTPLCTVQQAILTKNVNFKVQARISIIGALVGGILGVGMALKGYGVWSLAVSQALTAFIRTVLLWIWTRWYPRSKWNHNSFKYLWGYGSKLLAAGILDTIYQNIYPLIIGKFYNANSLGFYTRAQQLAYLPTSNVYGIIRRVTFPLLSEIQEEEERLRSVFIKVLRISVYLMFSIMCFIAGASKPIITVLLTDKWSDSIIYLQILSIAMMFRPIDSLNLNLLTVKGRTDLFLKLEIIKKIAGVIILIISIFYGVLAICIGYLCYCFIEIIIDSYYSGKYYKLPLVLQLKAMMPHLLLASIIFASTFVLSSVLSNCYVSLTCDCIVTLLIFIVGSKLLKLKEYKDLLLLINRKK